MSNHFRVWAVGLLAIMTASAVGCGDTVDEITNSITCAEVCGRYADCFDADYDVEGCADRCEDGADASEDKEQRLEICSACIDDRSCTEATFDCTDDCVGIVP
jgi:hypothetical protein